MTKITDGAKSDGNATPPIGEGNLSWDAILKVRLRSSQSFLKTPSSAALADPNELTSVNAFHMGNN